MIKLGSDLRQQGLESMPHLRQFSTLLKESNSNFTEDYRLGGESVNSALDNH